MHKAVLPKSPYAEDRLLAARIPAEFHRQIRHFAADRDVTVSVVIRAAIEQYLKDNGPRVRRAAGALNDRG